MRGIRTIVVGVDFSDAGDHAIIEGLTHVASGFAQAMYAVHVVDPKDRLLPSEEAPGHDADELLAVASRNLARRVGDVASAAGIPYYHALVRFEVRTGSAVEALMHACVDHHAEQLIVGTHGRRGLRRILLGSVAEALIRRADCPVLVARPQSCASRTSRASPPPDVGRTSSFPPPAGCEPRNLGDATWRPSDQWLFRGRAR